MDIMNIRSWTSDHGHLIMEDGVAAAVQTTVQSNRPLRSRRKSVRASLSSCNASCNGGKS